MRKILEELRQQHARDEARLDEILAEISRQGSSAEQRERAYAEMAKFNQELLRRNEIVMGESLDNVATSSRELREEIGVLGKEIRENRKWVRAQTQAILRVIDRLDEQGGLGSATA